MLGAAATQQVELGAQHERRAGLGALLIASVFAALGAIRRCGDGVNILQHDHARRAPPRRGEQSSHTLLSLSHARGKQVGRSSSKDVRSQLRRKLHGDMRLARAGRPHEEHAERWVVEEACLAVARGKLCDESREGLHDAALKRHHRAALADDGVEAATRMRRLVGRCRRRRRRHRGPAGSARLRACSRRGPPHRRRIHPLQRAGEVTEHEADGPSVCRSCLCSPSTDRGQCRSATQRGKVARQKAGRCVGNTREKIEASRGRVGRGLLAR
mmetsp:Transcript_13811/g.38079  ORF Transcript_13811/g.38079 Transcript_13811/m.38079 type:complete len:271 (+) Transcript_13811:442-1254(+)